MIDLNFSNNQAPGAKVLREKKLTLKEINKELVLHVNDNVAKCPFVNPFPMPQPLTGRVEFVTPICSTACQYFTPMVFNDKVTNEEIVTIFFDCVGCSKVVEKP